MEYLKKWVMNKPKAESISFLQNGSSIFELVGEGGNNFLLEYDILSGTINHHEEVELMGKVYKPLTDSLSTAGVVLLPTEAVEYGTTEQLGNEVQAFIHRYVQLTEFGEMIASQYVLLSWIYDNFETIPYLRFQGDYGSGKSRAEKAIGSICYRPIFAGGSTTPSPIFRVIQLYRGTLVIDEADFPRSDAAAEITKILNCGYSKGTPVLRTEGDREREPRAYNVFSPKILATRKTFDDVALESRCITERMRPKTRKDIPLHLPDEFYEDALKLRNKLLMFRFRNFDQLVYDPKFEIAGVEPRINQVMIPILALTQDDKRRQELIDFVKTYNRKIVDQRADSSPAQILQAIVELKENSDLSYRNIAKLVNDKRDLAHGEKAIQPTMIGRINKNEFNFEVSRPSNIAHIVWNQDLGAELCQRYGVELSAKTNNDVSCVSDVNYKEAKEIFIGSETGEASSSKNNNLDT